MSRPSSTASRSRKAARKGGAADGAPRPGRILHLDTFSGVAGNMWLAALLDLGLSRRELDADLAGLGLDFKLRVSRVKRGALAARYLDVRLPARLGRSRSADAYTFGDHGHGHDHDHGHGHDHDHDHGHDHGDGAGHDPKGGRDHGPDHGRTLADVIAVLEHASLAPRVRQRAVATFEALARAEARVHGVPLEEVHFHEVGMVDAIVDVTGVAIGMERLGIERVTAAPVAVGHGHIDSAHGRLPLPAPATLELLRGLPVVPAHVAWETVTPTGAALLRVFVDEFTPLPAMTVEAVGYGAGRDRDHPTPNLLRAVLGRASAVGRDRIAVLESHLDDLVPEHFEYLMQRLFEAGALDVSLQHLQMKKSRPGFGVRVLARPEDRLTLARVLFAESTAIGVRYAEWERLVLAREIRRVETPYGRVAVKCVHGEGGLDVSAEYDDCVRAARRHDTPLREVVRVAEALAREAFA